MVNYFFIYRPFHFEYVSKMIKEHFSSDTNILINHYPTPYTATANDGISRLVNLPGGFLQKAGGVKAVKKELLQLAKSNTPVTVFIPHTLGILSNYSYYRLATRYSNVTINVFYEGVIVFYGYDHDYFENLGYYVSRWFVSLFSGILYTIDKRLLDLKDKRIKKIYTPFLNLDVSKDKLVETRLEQLSFEPVKNSCLILGLKLDDKYMDELPKIIKGMYNMTSDLNIDKIFFKPHPADKSDQFFTIAKEMGKQLTLINDTTPVEKIIGNYAPGYVISAWSSGIINLSNMLPGSIKLYCFVTESLTIRPEDKKLVNAFSEQGVNVIYV